ncbi:MAG: fatty acid desaturase family protein, partial [Flammeovirgaceae bacterium]
SFFFGGGCILFYSLIIFGGFNVYTMWLFAAILGFFCACIGFNISHDAIHGAYSSKHWVNKFIGVITFNVLGANDHVWRMTHNLVHHTYTNIPGHDEDIDVAPGLVRLSPEEELKPHMKYQHFYAMPLYGLASISWVFRKDFKKFFQKQIGQTENKHKPMDYFNLFFFKALNYTLFIIIPLIVLDITWWQFIIGFVTMHMFFGLTLGLVFQLAHVVEGPEFPEPNEAGNIEEVWAIHQMRTTANFAMNSWLANFICGGLNMQIEHHLFPLVCHTHYRQISKIVKATAHEFGVPYHENKTFLGATMSHIRMLKKFGREALVENQNKKLELVN